ARRGTTRSRRSTWAERPGWRASRCYHRSTGASRVGLPRIEEAPDRVTAVQRLRLVIALGVVNLVLAGVALGFGIAGLPASNQIAAGPTQPSAIVLPQPTTPPETTRPESSARPIPTATPTAPGGEPPASTPPATPA